MRQFKMVYDFEKPIVELENKIDEMLRYSEEMGVDLDSDIKRLKKKCDSLKKDVYSNLSASQRVKLARHPDRPASLDYVKMITDDFIELHGDRYFSDDPAMITGLGWIDKYKVVVIAQEKGKTTKEKLYRNFGMSNPEGYRKALRLMKMAAKFKRPILTIIDTPGAYPGIGAEERGQAEAIARNLLEMSRLPVPVIAAVIGEGASGGALGIGVGDVILMLENSWYSVISPEGCAAIRWRDGAKAELAAAALKLTAKDLIKQNVIDVIVPEPLGGAHWNPEEAGQSLKKSIIKEIEKLMRKKPEELIKNRIKKFDNMGYWED
ncbi:MAG: acetyl-CoA carboxylase carboxyltransferase subunit alpha [Calditrichia bacterium]|nr:acetyl-CoA carboxylase carboxyltransferase subunit alpha [Calditrichia bacterium]